MKPVTGADSGTGLWLLQRGTAVVMALMLPVLIWRIDPALPLDFSDWKNLFAPQWMRIMTWLFTVALAMHAWIGMHDILMDYVRPLGLRLALYLIVIVTLAACVTAMAAVLWGVR